MAGAYHARKDAARVAVRAHGAYLADDGAGAVGLLQAVGAVALYDAGVAVTLADAGHVDALAFFEYVGLQDVAHIEGGAVLEAELMQVLEAAGAGLRKMSALGLGELALGDFAEAELDDPEQRDEEHDDGQRAHELGAPVAQPSHDLLAHPPSTCKNGTCLF